MCIRDSLVITRHGDDIEGARVMRTVQEAVEATRDRGRVFVIGGATVYMAMFQYLDRIHVTKIGAQPKMCIRDRALAVSMVNSMPATCGKAPTASGVQ